MVDTSVDNIERFLEAAGFSDLIVPGYVDRVRGGRCFRPMLDSVYLQADEEYLKVTAINQGDQLALSVVLEVEHDEAVLEDPDVDVAIGCLSELFFGESQKLSCASARFILDENSQINDGIVRGVELTFADGQKIILDPRWTFGVRPEAANLGRFDRIGVGSYEYLEVRTWSRAGDM